MKQTEKMYKVLLRPQITIKHLLQCSNAFSKFIHNSEIENIDEVLESAEIQVKYESYIERESLSAEKLKRLDYVKIPDNFDFNRLQSLSTEAKQKLKKVNPKSIGQASGIPGVSPADISALLIYFGR